MQIRDTEDEIENDARLIFALSPRSSTDWADIRDGDHDFRDLVRETRDVVHEMCDVVPEIHERYVARTWSMRRTLAEPSVRLIISPAPLTEESSPGELPGSVMAVHQDGVGRIDGAALSNAAVAAAQR